MSDEIEAGGAAEPTPEIGDVRRKAVPMRVGNATVYIIQTGETNIVSGEYGEDEIYTVAPNVREAFDKAVDVIRETVGKIGEGVQKLAEKAMPQELEVEFSLTFEATAKTAIIPIFVNAEHGLGTGLKITAVWKREDMKPDGKESAGAKKHKGAENNEE